MSHCVILISKRVFILILALVLWPQINGFAADSVKVVKQVVASGGGSSSNSEYAFKSTIGQAIVGSSIIDDYQVFSGFWGGLSLNCCLGITGDLNSDGSDNTVLDLTFLINQIYRGGPTPLCPGEGDLDGNGTPSQVLDLTAMINKLYRGGPEPASCGFGF